MKKLIIVICLLIAGCASLDSKLLDGAYIRLEPYGENYRFTAIADAVYPLDTGEAVRIQWLEDRLHGKKYKILNREWMRSLSTLFGETYLVYYTVKIDK